jgi:hypothetical protein
MSPSLRHPLNWDNISVLLPPTILTPSEPDLVIEAVAGYGAW